MNAELKRQRMDNSGALWDVQGNSSLGMLPVPSITVKNDKVVFTSANSTPSNSLQIGALPDNSVVATNGNFSEEAIDKAVARVSKQTKGLTELPNTGNQGQFLDQGVMNPVKAYQ